MARFNPEETEVEVKITLRYDVSWKDCFKMRLTGSKAIQAYVKELMEKQMQIDRWLEE